MNKENVLNALDQLLITLQSIKSITEAADFGSRLEEIIDNVLNIYTPIVQEAKDGKIREADFEPAHAAVKALNTLVVHEKATNPLISDELVSLAAKSEHEADEVEQLLKLAGSPKGKPWYSFILRWFGKRG